MKKILLNILVIISLISCESKNPVDSNNLIDEITEIVYHNIGGISTIYLCLKSKPTKEETYLGIRLSNSPTNHFYGVIKVNAKSINSEDNCYEKIPLLFTSNKSELLDKEKVDEIKSNVDNSDKLLVSAKELSKNQISENLKNILKK